jgi:2-phospho-L-lactate/phosphoenolpyruvate guanylyltransferase
VVSTAVILPVKSFAKAKQRLGERYAGAVRAALAAAMVEDVLDELDRAALGPVILVSREPGLRAGVVTVHDEHEQGQSAAALLGLARAGELGCNRALLVPGDCPLIDAEELRGLAARAEALDVAIVPDRHGTGTNALALVPGGPFEPQFGPGSRARHVDQAEHKGLSYEVIQVACLELDVDTRDDATALAGALARFPGRAPHTREALGRLTPA